MKKLLLGHRLHGFVMGLYTVVMFMDNQGWHLIFKIVVAALVMYFFIFGTTHFKDKEKEIE